MPLSIRNVQKVYGSNGTAITAVDNVSLEIADGQFISLIGPSGCGKSTLLSMIAGFDAVSAGTITGIGQPAMVFQEAALFPWRTIRDNVAFGLQMRGMGKAERRERAEEALRMVHLGRFANSYPHELSGGMRQRAAIARALVIDPGVLLMDEPFGALDAQTRSLLQGELLSVWEHTHKTVVFVTHSLEEALSLSDRVILMSARPGRVLGDFVVDAPRPRDLADPVLASLRTRLMDLLTTEVNKVAQAEMDADWHGSGRVIPAAGDNIGAEI